MSDEEPQKQLQGEDGAQERQTAAKVLGQARTDAKAKAARENGKRGGRPKGTVVSEETRQKISESKRMKPAENPPTSQQERGD